MIAFDFESCLIQPGLMAPPPVCMTTSEGAIHVQDMSAPIAALLSDSMIVGVNVAYDMALILQHYPQHREAVFRAYSESRVVDALVAERLGEIATGKPSQFHGLESLCTRYGVRGMQKADSPRLDYARLLGKPLAYYTEAEKQYAIFDAEATLQVYQRIRAKYGTLIKTEAIASETRHAFWLHLCASRGLRSRIDNVEALRADAEKQVNALRSEAIRNGFIRETGVKDTKAIKTAVRAAYGPGYPITKKGLEVKKNGGSEVKGKFVEQDWKDLKYVATDKVALEDSGDPELMAFARYGEWAAVVNKDLEMLEGGTRYPIHTRYGIADTTRTTSSGPNMQNFRRLQGIRECIVPRDGHCFGAFDVTGLELGTFAQVLSWKLGSKHMADMITGGMDLHSVTAAKMLDLSYDDFRERLKAGDEKCKDARQLCKAPNFGYPGGMSAKTLVKFARAQGATVSVAKAVELKKNWSRTFPEGPAYLRWINHLENKKTERYDFMIPGSPGIFRAGATYCSAANGHFQGLGAQVMKQAGWEIMLESWTDTESPLYGIGMVLFIHDEFIFEIPVGKQHAVMVRAREVLLRVLHRMLPDVNLDADLVAMAYWSKDAKMMYNKNGELEIWNG